MKKGPWVSWVLVVVAACVATGYERPTAIATPVDTPTLQSPPQTSDYRVRVEFILPEEQIQEFPSVAMAFYDAVSEWAKLIPIDPVISTSKIDLDHRGVRDGRWDEPDVIKVRIVDLQTYLWSSPEMIGVWFPSSRQLFLDSDFLSDPAFPQRARATAMHELGHVFGLPHVVSRRQIDKVRLGDITLLPENKPELYTMYHTLTSENVMAVPSALEIQIAKNYILYGVDTYARNLDCDLTLTDN